MKNKRQFKDFEEKVETQNKRRIEQLLETCRESRRSDYQRYIDSYKIAGASQWTIQTHLASLRKWDTVIEKEFSELAESDIQATLLTLEEKNYSQATKETHKLNLRTFLKFIGRNDLSPSFVMKRTGNNKLPEDLLTKDEVAKLIEAAINPRDRAVISLIYESGCRRGELLGLRLKNITPHDRGFYIHFPNGKTGARKILVIYSAMYIQQWLTVHPEKDNREAYLVCPLQDGLVPVSTTQLVKLLSMAGKRAGIQKKVNPHSFRHAQATELAKDFTEQQLKNYLGWTPDSKMASIYVHLSGRDMDDAVLKKNGIEIDHRDTRLKPTECPRCHHVVPAGTKYCGFCGTSLTKEAADTVDSAKEDLLKLILENPDIMAAIKSLQK